MTVGPFHAAKTGEAGHRPGGPKGSTWGRPAQPGRPARARPGRQRGRGGTRGLRPDAQPRPGLEMGQAGAPPELSGLGPASGPARPASFFFRFTFS